MSELAAASMAGVGEPAAAPGFEDFYRANVASVTALAYALCGSRPAAEELAQDAFADAARRWSRIGAYEDPAAFVRRAVANRSVSLVRRRVAEAKALRRVAAERGAPSGEPTVAGDDEAFWEAVRALPRRQAQAVALHYVDDRTTAEIAEVLGCAESTVRVHLTRGRRALATALRLDARDDEEEGR